MRQIGVIMCSKKRRDAARLPLYMPHVRTYTRIHTYTTHTRTCTYTHTQYTIHNTHTHTDWIQKHQFRIFPRWCTGECVCVCVCCVSRPTARAWNKVDIFCVLCVCVQMCVSRPTASACNAKLHMFEVVCMSHRCTRISYSMCLCMCMCMTARVCVHYVSCVSKTCVFLRRVCALCVMCL